MIVAGHCKVNTEPNTESSHADRSQHRYYINGHYNVVVGGRGRGRNEHPRSAAVTEVGGRWSEIGRVGGGVRNRRRILVACLGFYGCFGILLIYKKQSICPAKQP